MRNRIVMALVAASSAALIASGQDQVPRDDAYVSGYRLQLPAPALDAKI